ncbi:hypothetical protein NCCP28_09480 [Niallia sp. NCCP-28]|nr:hypothetical protein NCCP28_09480 [Niallia sp. NCCP-28]
MLNKQKTFRITEQTKCTQDSCGREIAKRLGDCSGEYAACGLNNNNLYEDSLSNKGKKHTQTYIVLLIYGLKVNVCRLF